MTRRPESRLRLFDIDRGVALRRAGMLFIASMALVAGAACGGSSTKPSTTGASPSTTVHFSGSPSSKFCDLARSLAQKTVLSPNVDLRRVYQDFDSEAPQLRAAAPSSIRPDIVAVIAGLRTLKDALAAVNYDETRLDPASLKLLQDTRFEESASRVSAYYQQVCGVQSSTSSVPPTTPVP